MGVFTGISLKETTMCSPFKTSINSYSSFKRAFSTSLSCLCLAVPGPFTGLSWVDNLSGHNIDWIILQFIRQIY